MEFELEKFLGAVGGGAVVVSLVILVFVFMLLGSFPLERRRMKKARAALTTGRSALTNEEFLRRIEAEPDLTSFYVTARRVMARLCCLPTEIVYPEDTMRSLMNLQFDGGFIQDFLFGLQHHAGVFIKEDQFGSLFQEQMPFRSFIKELAHCSEPAASRLGQAGGVGTVGPT